MTEVIEINYISPISDYVFDKIKKYYLIIINGDKMDTVIINKLIIQDINNVTDTNRAFYIGKCIQLYSSCDNRKNKSQSSYYITKLFEHDMATNKIKLLFTGNLNVDELEYNSIKVSYLGIPSKVVGSARIGNYNNDASFLEEQFFNYETITEKKCMLFISKRQKSTKPIIKPFCFKFEKSPDIYVYDRYNKTVIREQNFIGLDNFCNSNTFNDYVKFIKSYSIDVNRYINKKKDTFKSMFMRKINPQFRLLSYNPYSNNIICSPVDGRIIGFDINKDTKFNFYGIPYHYTNFVGTDAQNILNASGFMNRMTPYDYQRINVPYSAYLTEISISNKYITLKFESDYFMPPDVYEREYISVVYGHNIQMSRGYPELVEVQPKTKLLYYLVLFSNKLNDSIVFTNNNLINIGQSLKVNTSSKMKIWLEGGEELGVFNCCLGSTLILLNRPIIFTSDIDFYSGPGDGLNNKIECFIRTKDMIGLIQ